MTFGAPKIDDLVFAIPTDAAVRYQKLKAGECHLMPYPNAADVQPDVFAGPLLAKGERYSFTFTKVGSYPYHCAPHPYMQGAVVVTE